MTDNSERDRVLAERQKARWERDFDPGYRPENMPDAEHRLANAAEYTAHQLGQINRKLDRLIAALELLATRG